MLQLKTVHRDTYSLLKKLSKKDYLTNFALAGGTSLALQLGHRISIDLDFFTLEEFDSIKLMEQIRADFKISNVSTSENTLSLYVNCNKNNIKVEFLRHNYKLLKEFREVDQIKLYSTEDIAAMKLNAVANRGSKKDFFDINELLKSFSIVELINFFKTKYSDHNAFTVIKSLEYFEDAELEPDPICLNNTSWKQVKERIITEINNRF